MSEVKNEKYNNTNQSDRASQPKKQDIPSFIRDNNNELYMMMSQLNLLTPLVAKTKNTGRTFLMPNAALMQKIRDSAYADDGREEALDIIKSLILMSCVSSLDDFRSDEGIVSYRKTKLPAVEKLDRTGYISLKNGAKITYNKQFKYTKDSNIMIYDLIEGDVHANMEKTKVNFREIKSAPKEKKISDLKIKLFQKYMTSSESAAKCITGIINYLIDLYTANGDEMLVNKIKTVMELCSTDAVISLYIILQPYRSPEKMCYLTDDELNGFDAKKINSVRSYIYDAITSGTPNELPDKFKPYYDKNNERINELAAVEKEMDRAQPPTICQLIYDFICENLNLVNPLRRAIYSRDSNADESLAIAEAELRLTSYLQHSNGDHAAFVKNQLIRNYTLDTPYLCNKFCASRAHKTNLSSLPYTILRSNIILYISGDQSAYNCMPNSRESLIDEDKKIIIDIDMLDGEL
jgi:hypothetical protein